MKKNVKNHSHHPFYPVLAKIRINRGLLYHFCYDSHRRYLYIDLDLYKYTYVVGTLNDLKP